MNIRQRMAEATRGTIARPQRPKLRSENIEEYLDWLTRYGTPQELDAGLKAAELVVRLKMGQAQAKTTHAQLIEQGVVDPGAANG